MFNSLSVTENVPLAPFTTFRIGGVARYFLRARSKADVITALQEACAEKLPVFILGGGSDVLINDRGFKGLVIKMELNQLKLEQNILFAEAGVLINGAIRYCTQQGYSGLEFATGVPATIGGAVWANLGCRGSEISQVLETVTVCDVSGVEKTFTNADCQFGYRDSRFKHEPWIILSATFIVRPGKPAELRHTILQLTHLKKKEQDVGEACAGCAFRNPAHEVEAGLGLSLSSPVKTAAQLIDELGLKGYQIGGAKVSEKHANFILNVGNATADDVVQLISYIKQQVRDKRGVQLMEEIDYIGF